MLSLFRTRVKARASIGVALVGFSFCAALGGVYVLSGQAYASVADSRPDSPPAPVMAPAKTEDANARAPAGLASPQPAVQAVAAPPAAPVRSAVAAVAARQLDCLAAAVYFEARGEPLAGQAAVAQVVLNRARGPSFPKSVCGVVYQGSSGSACQFSFACNGAMRRPREIAAWLRAREVAARALDGYVMAQIGQATCFHAARLGAGGARVVRVGGHVFYAGAGRAWVPGASRPTIVAQAAAANTTPPRLTFALGVLTAVSGNAGGQKAAGTLAPRLEADVAPSQTTAAKAAS